MTTRRTFLKGTAGVVGYGASAWTASALGGEALSDEPRLDVAFYTDVHSRVEGDTPQAMRLAAEAINHEKPDLVLCGGDLITDGFQAGADSLEPRWDAYFQMHKAIEAPIHAAVGNHDLVGAIPEDGSVPAEDPRAVFCTKLGLERTYRSFDFFNYHFIILDSFEIVGGDLKYRGFIGEEQMAWLKADLSQVPATQGIVLLSHMPLLSGYAQMIYGGAEALPENRVVVNNREVLACFEKHNLLAVLQGHLHVNESMEWNGIRFITGGAVCAKWWRGSWHGTEEGFGLLKLRGSRVDWHYVDYGWDAKRPKGV